MKMKTQFSLIAGLGLALAMCISAAAQSTTSGAPMSSDQIKKQAAAQKKASETKEKWMKAQEKTKNKHNSHLLTQIGIFESHNRERYGDLH